MRYDNVILGENFLFSTDCEKTGINNNILVVGGSGSGKTMSVSEPCLLETYNSSLIVTVTKRRIVDDYKQLFKLRGYNVLDLNLVEPELSTVSFDFLDDEYIQSYADIEYIAKSIVCSATNRQENTAYDPYWEQSATALLCAEMGYVFMLKGSEGTFADVLETHDNLTFTGDSTIKTSLDDRFEAFFSAKSNPFFSRCWNTFKKLPVKTANCVYSTLSTALNIFIPELKAIMADRTNRLDFKKLCTEKTVLFITTSAVNPSLQKFVNLFYGQAFKSMFEFAESLKENNRQLPIPVRIICDDFATGAQIPDFQNYISIFREKQISVTLLLQSESQLEAMYGETNATTIINNCDTYIYLGSMCLKSAKSVSERLNVPLEDILNMPIGKEIIFRRGQKPIITKRYNIREHEEYKKLGYIENHNRLVPFIR